MKLIEFLQGIISKSPSEHFKTIDEDLRKPYFRIRIFDKATNHDLHEINISGWMIIIIGSPFVTALGLWISDKLPK